MNRYIHLGVIHLEHNTTNLPLMGSTRGVYFTQGWKNPVCYANKATIFFKVVPSICGFSVQSLLRVTLLTSGILRGLLDIWTICSSLILTKCLTIKSYNYYIICLSLLYIPLHVSVYINNHLAALQHDTKINKYTVIHSMSQVRNSFH